MKRYMRTAEALGEQLWERLWWTPLVAPLALVLFRSK
jgi:hypothetical protein